MPTSPRAKDYVIALLRSGIQGGAVDIAGGLTGLARMPREGLEGFNAAMEQADVDMGYHPQGAELQALQNIGEFLSPVTEPIGQAVDAVGESNPALGAMLRASPAMLPLAGKAGRLGKTILEEELRRPSGSKSAQRGHFRYFDYTNEPSESRTRARKALEHLDNGAPAAEIWKEYGWGREPVTNRPITEISDFRLDVPSNKLYRGPDGDTLLFGARKGDTGDHLLKDSILRGEAYLKYLDSNYKIRGNPQKNLGAATHYAPFATESGLIEMGPQASYADFMDTLVHELNHGMQSRFGAPRGGSPEQFGYKDFEKKYFDADEEYRNYIEALKGKLPPGDAQEVDLIMSEKNLTPEHLGRRDSEIIHRAGRLLPDPEIQRALIESLRAVEQKKLFKSEMRGARKKYDNLHGEAMSRLAQSRRTLGPQLIRSIYPFEPTYFKQQTGTDIGELDVKEVGRASSGEDTLKFLDTTGLPLIEEARKSPAYSRLYKGVEVEDVEMTPDEFLDQATGGGMAYDTSWIDYDKLDRLRELDEAGTAVDRPALFRYDPEAYWPDQHEGRHRALIAEEGGAEKIPVTIYREGLSKDPDLWSKVLSGEISEQDALLELLKRSQK